VAGRRTRELTLALRSHFYAFDIFGFRFWFFYSVILLLIRIPMVMIYSTVSGFYSLPHLLGIKKMPHQARRESADPLAIEHLACCCKPNRAECVGSDTLGCFSPLLERCGAEVCPKDDYVDSI
jgi:hypothetical protein